MTEVIKCYLYWIHTKDQKDIFSEGYVGVSRNPEWRFYQHKRNAINPKAYKNYRTAFRTAMADGSAIYEVILCASEKYCLEVEGKLRPDWKIGWNLASGGNGGCGTHGLGGTAVKRAYYNMLTRARESDAIVCDEWNSSQNGIINFKAFYDSIPEGLKIYTAGLSYVSPETVQLLSRAEISANVHRKNLYKGELYTIKELGEMFGVKPNTLSWRIKRGANLLEALGVEDE